MTQFKALSFIGLLGLSLLAGGCSAFQQRLRSHS